VAGVAVTLGQAFVRISPDTSDFANDLRKDTGSALAQAGEQSGRGYAQGFESQAKGRMSTLFKTVAGVAVTALASGAVLKGAKQLVDQASDLAETGNKVNVIYGRASGQVQRFAKNALTSFGQTQQSALDAAATFGVFGKAAGLTGRENAKFSKELVKLSSVPACAVRLSRSVGTGCSSTTPR
jgi:hypothetical protein